MFCVRVVRLTEPTIYTFIQWQLQYTPLSWCTHKDKQYLYQKHTAYHTGCKSLNIVAMVHVIFVIALTLQNGFNFYSVWICWPCLTSQNNLLPDGALTLGSGVCGVCKWHVFMSEFNQTMYRGWMIWLLFKGC